MASHRVSQHGGHSVCPAPASYADADISRLMISYVRRSFSMPSDNARFMGEGIPSDDGFVRLHDAGR